MSDLEDLDFTRPAKHETYDPAVARSCFESFGKPHSVAQGQPFFAEGEASGTMYFLLEGEVGLLRGKKSLDVVKAGEIFGELAAITQQPRSASAVARSACRALSLDATQFQQAIQRTPEFVLMLMSILINRLRLTDAMLRMTRSLPEWGSRHETRVFDRKLLKELEEAIAPEECPRGKVIMKEGERGVFMYVVVEGRITITIQGTVVERIGAGGIFGEMALVDQSERAASAIADSDCRLLAISRKDFIALVRTKPAFAVSLLKAVAERLRYMSTHQK